MGHAMPTASAPHSAKCACGMAGSRNATRGGAWPHWWLRTGIRKFREAAASGDKDAADEALKAASRKLDKAVSKGVIHANQAANKKSAMAKKAAAL